MKARIHYNKLSPLSMISHLDIQKTFQRAFRRAGITLVHSTGFHPHPKISYAPPLPLFAASLDEIMDIQIVNDIDAENLKKALNNALPEKIQVTSAEILSENDPPLSEKTKEAIYEISFYNIQNKEDNINKITNFLNITQKILVEKKSKKGIIKIDIKPYIKNIDITRIDNGIKLNINLPLSSEKIISPNLIIKALIENVLKDENINTKIIKLKTITN